MTRLLLVARRRCTDAFVLTGLCIGFVVISAIRPPVPTVLFVLAVSPFVTMPLLRLVAVLRQQRRESYEARVSSDSPGLKSVVTGSRRALIASLVMATVGVWVRSDPSFVAVGFFVEALVTALWLLSAIETIALERRPFRLGASSGLIESCKHVGRLAVVAACGGFGILPAAVMDTAGVSVVVLAAKQARQAASFVGRGHERTAAAPAPGEVSLDEERPSGEVRPPDDGRTAGSEPVAPSTTSTTRPRAAIEPNRLRVGDDEIQLIERGAACAVVVIPAGDGPIEVLDPLVATLITNVANQVDDMFVVSRHSEATRGLIVTYIVRFPRHGEEVTIVYDRERRQAKTTLPSLPRSRSSPTRAPVTTVPVTDAAAAMTTVPSLSTVPREDNEPHAGEAQVPPVGTAPATTESSTTTTSTTTTSVVSVPYLAASNAPASCDDLRSILSPLAEKVNSRNAGPR